MKKIFAALAACLVLGLAQAGVVMSEGGVRVAAGPTVSVIVSQACDVALTKCTLTDDAGHAILVAGPWVYSGAVSVSVDGAAQACVASSVVLQSTQYRIDRHLTVTCGDGSALDGTWSSTRSGSGRGGWSWHQHVTFNTLTLY